MITLIHGDFINASRNELNRIRSGFTGREIRHLDGIAIDEAKLIQALQSSSMFGGDTAIIIENLFGKLGRKIKLIEKLAKIIASSSDNAEIIVWENKEVGKTVVSSLGPHTKVLIYKIPPVIFKFLDAISPQNHAECLSLYEQLAKQDAPELVLMMLVKRVRQLIMLNDGVVPDGLVPWQAGKLTSQAKHFTLEKLLIMYKRLLDIEFAIKSGSSALNLSQHIELLLVDL
jgi:DNA polymerase III delta subunit